MKSALAILCLGCLAMALPPIPVAPKHHKPMVGLTQGAGAAALLVKPKLVVAPTVLLSWQYSGNPGYVKFKVYSFKGPLQAPDPSWPVVAVVSSNSCRLPVDKTASATWFAVTAVSINGLESDWAGR